MRRRRYRGVDRAVRRLHLDHALAQRLRAAGQFVDGFAAHPQPHEEAADLSRRGIAGHHDLERVARLRQV
jgi:hypothetical protein